MSNERHLQVIAELQAGKRVTRREKGSSMIPIIKSGEPHTLEPVTDPALIDVGDVVYCKVRGHFYTHLVTAIRKNKKDLEFQISNNHGHVNGWTRQVFGRVVSVGADP